MSEIVVPDAPRSPGPLPFSEAADLLAQGGAVVLAGIASSPAWPRGSATTRGGQAYDHEAELEHSAALVDELTATANRKLRVGGVTYSIVDHEAHEFVPHVVVRLRTVRGG